MSNNNHPIYVTSPGLPPFEEYVDEIRSLWETGILTHQGPKYRALEKELEKYLGIPYVPLFANGHLALQVLLRAQGWDKGEVITTPFTFGSTTMAIAECGLKPVFCDVRRDTFTIDTDKIESLITPQTKAILPVHVYGMPCDVDRIDEIAQRYGLKVFYDAAHAFGETLDGRALSDYGDASMFSFHATKVFNTVEGGALCLHDEKTNDVACKIRQFGAHGDGAPVHYIGTNAKMTEIHAAMGLCNMRHLDEYIEKRRAVFETYHDLLSGAKGLELLHYPKGLKPNYAYYPVVFEDEFGASRDKVAEKLEGINVFARKYFFPGTNHFEVIEEKYGAQSAPVSDDLSRRVLCLPLHPNMTPEDAERIARCVVSAGELR